MEQPLGFMMEKPLGSVIGLQGDWGMKHSSDTEVIVDIHLCYMVKNCLNV